MRKYAVAALAAWTLMSAGAAAAADVSAETALSKYCEPLLSGSSARQVQDLARADGLENAVVAGQKVLRQGDLLVGLSDSPRVCFVQAPGGITLAQGFVLADAWAKRHPGAVRSPATQGPDGSPVRGWSAPGRKIALVATQQQAESGQKVMAFILMPLPAGLEGR
jgi:hypothetical protein